jgi:hypothetical protein
MISIIHSKKLVISFVKLKLHLIFFVLLINYLLMYFNLQVYQQVKSYLYSIELILDHQLFCRFRLMIIKVNQHFLFLIVTQF